MPKTNVYDMTGKQVGEIELSEAIFGIEPNESVVHDVVKNHLANCRQGTQSCADPRRGFRRRHQAVASEGHRPRPSGQHPRPPVVRMAASSLPRSPEITATPSTRR